jgi:protein phosphatase
MEETTAEYQAADLVAPVEVRVRTQVQFGCKTDMGRVRENNEDKHEFFVPVDDQELANKGRIFVVCDGMGGAEAGQLASELSCKTFIDVYRSHLGDSEAAIRGAIMAANRYTHEVQLMDRKKQGMGTTLSALILVQDKAFIGQVGDSRVYRVRDGQVEQLTTDHTWVEETVKAGVMTREEAEASRYRHVITRAIGPEAEVEPDVFSHEVQAGDTFLICSDGVTNHVSDAEIGRILGENSPSEAAWKVVGAALVGGGTDNATCIVVRVTEVVAA